MKKFRSMDLDPVVDTGKATSTRTVLAVVGVSVVVGFVIGILIGRFATCPAREPAPVPSPSPSPDGLFLPGVSESLVQDGDPAISDLLLQSLNKNNIENYLRYLSEEPHIAGSQRDHDLARHIHDFWVDNGLDDVTLAPYDVLLSYPDEDEPNLVRLLNASGDVIYESPLEEDILTPDENRTGVVRPFNAYSANGTVQGDLVYVNYGRVEDYDWLQNNGINVSGKLVIARYGKIFRGSKVVIAQRKGATGVILYSDPADYTAGNDSRVYPHTYWLPPSGTQRGTIYTGSQDPLTPGYPSIASAYRYPEDQVDLPKIPCHPIGYGIAEPILRALGGPQAPEDWRGGLNISYNLGPGFTGSEVRNGSIQIRISTRNQRRLSYNVIGVIRGAVEPDRYVLFGNHRDAWVFGAIDPSSGTATMMEIARAMGQLVKTGRWRPRRSIIFCSWGAEEYGLIGSTEWVEQYVKNLQMRAVAYLNVDIAVQGNHSLRALGTPMLFQTIFDAAKKVPNPDSSERSSGGPATVYDKWVNTYPKEGSNVPRISSPGSGSDYAPILQLSGIPVMDFRYTYDTSKWHIASYPLYHSMYETFHAVKDIVDRNFECHLAVARLGAELTRHLADQLFIPLRVSELGEELLMYSGSLTNAFGRLLEQHLDDVSLLNSSIANFTSVAQRFEQKVTSISRYQPLQTRMVNDQLMLLNKAFLDPSGLPLRPNLKHLLYAENSNDAYAGSSFPGLADLLFEIDLQPNAQERWEQVKRHYSVIVFTIQSAASTLEEVTEFVLDHL